MRLFQTTYRDRDGKRRTASRWYVEFRDHRRRVRRLPAFTDKRASRAFGQRIERLVELRVAGDSPDVELARWVGMLPDKTRERLARIGLLDMHRFAASKPLADHVTDYERSLTDSGATPDYVKKTSYRVRAIIDGIGARFLADVSASAVSRYLAERRAGKTNSDSSDVKKKVRALSAKSSNHYLAAMKSFFNWLGSERRVTENPISHLSAQNANADRRHVRRALEPEELRRLLDAARTGPERFGMTADGRYWLYRVAVETGLRSGELRSLTRAGFDLSSSEPTVTIEAVSAKNGKAATLPLRPDTAAEMGSFIGPKMPTAGVFKMPRPEEVVVMLRADLEAAEIPYADDTGRVADFHALRGTFASLLLRSGVDVRTAKDLMRHSTIAMTGDVYACTFRGTMAEAVRNLPELSRPSADRERATGTDSVLASCLALDGADPLKSVRGGASSPANRPDAQAPRKLGKTGDSSRVPMHVGAGRDPSEKLPPRGIEPLLPA